MKKEDLSRNRLGAVLSLFGFQNKEIADLAVHQVLFMKIPAGDFGGDKEIGGASAIEVEGVEDVPIRWGLG